MGRANVACAGRGLGVLSDISAPVLSLCRDCIDRLFGFSPAPTGLDGHTFREPGPDLLRASNIHRPTLPLCCTGNSKQAAGRHCLQMMDKPRQKMACIQAREGIVAQNLAQHLAAGSDRERT